MNPPDTEQARWFTEEVQPHESSLRAYLGLRFPTLTDADDLVQETYSRMLRARARQGVRSAKSLLFAIARNAALDRFRRKQAVSIEGLANIDELSVLEDRAGAPEALSRDQELQLLDEAIQTLPKRCREILVLKKIEGRSYSEISDRLGISKNTISAQLTIGVLRCRVYLQSRGMSKGWRND